jgi:hypothetical protein
MSILCSMVGATFTVAATGQVLRAKKTITAVGNAQVDTAQSQFGGASALFDGTGDYLTVTNIAGGITDDQTFEFWIRFANLPTSGGFRMVAGDGGGARYLGLLNDGGTYRWEVSFSDGQYVERFTTSVSTNTWYHVALTKSGSTLKMYQAGSALTSAVSFNTMAPEKTLFVAGTNYIGSWNTDSNFFNGHMDEIRVSNNVRYTTTFTPSTTPFIDDSNTVLLIHANGTDASTVFEDDNGIGRSPVGIYGNGNAQVDTAQSKFGEASLLLDGTGDFLELVGVNISRSDNFTCEAWIRLAALPGTNSFSMLLSGVGGGEQYMSIKNISGTYVSDIVVNNGTTVREEDYTISSISTNTWYHWAIVKNGSTITHYFNGTALTTLLSSQGTMTSGHGFNAINKIGVYSNNSLGWNGHLDEIRVSNTARYTANFTPSTTPFVNDANTVLLIHANGTDASTVFTDDNAQLTVTPAATSVNEGTSLTFNVSTVNTADQTLYYTATNAGDFATSSGSFSLANNAGSFSLTPTADTTTEGAETFTASVRTGSTSGDIVATSSAVTINDTSLAVTDSITSLGINYSFSQYHYDKLSYAGLDSSSRPVYLFGWADPSASYYPKVVLWRVNSDLSITAGSATTLFSEASIGCVAAVDTDNNYGAILHIKDNGAGDGAGGFMKAFTIDKDNLTIGTPGASVTAYSGSDATACAIDYAGGGRFHTYHRRNGAVGSNKYITRSGTTLTVSAEIVSNFGSQVYTQLRAFTASGSLYRSVVSGSNTNPQAQAYYWNNTSGSTVSSQTAISWTSMASINPHPLCRLSPADKFLLATYNNSGSMQMAAGTVTWPSSGTSAPTISTGTALTLSDAVGVNGTADGFGNDEAYVLYRKLSTNELYWRKITSSGNTLTQGSANLLTSSGANLSGIGILCHGVQAFSKKLLVGICDNTTTVNPTIIVTQVT